VYTATIKNIVVLLLTLGSVSLYGQQTRFQASAKKTDSIRYLSAGFSGATVPLKTAYFNVPILSEGFSIRTSQDLTSVAGLQKDLYIKSFGFFCKKEMQIEKSVRLPLRFRLGSLEQCNILEQKY